MLHGVQVLVAVHHAALQVVDGDALAAGEAVRGLRGVALRVERDGRLRALVFLYQRLRGVGHADDLHNQAARRRVHGHVIVGNAGGGKTRGHHLLQLLRSGHQVECGNLLAADLECKRMLSQRHDYSPFPSAAAGTSPTTFSRYEAQQSFAMPRTRSM